MSIVLIVKKRNKKTYKKMAPPLAKKPFVVCGAFRYTVPSMTPWNTAALIEVSGELSRADGDPRLT